MLVLRGIEIDEHGNKVQAYIGINNKIYTYSIQQVVESILSGTKIKNAGIKNDTLIYTRNAGTKDLSNSQINDWTVIEYIGGTPNRSSGRWLCKCKCNKYKAVDQATLLNGSSKSCGSCGGRQRGVLDITHKTFGDWYVEEYVGDYKWRCVCRCGTRKILPSNCLLDGRSTSCGHDTTGLNDLTNRQFNDWTVIDYAGNRQWNCRCSCGTERIVAAQSLISGKSTSCGHIKQGPYFEIYGNAENFKDYLETFAITHHRLPCTDDLIKDFNIARSVILKYIHEAELENLVEIKAGSNYENMLYDFLTSLGLHVDRHNKTIIKPLELDLYVAEHNIAIEFNGSYWHSTEQKPKDYHLNKTKLCAEHNIRLIHIFEHEYQTEEQQQHIHTYLRNVFCTKQKIYARDTEIRLVNTVDTSKFLTKYHLQGSSKYSLALGLYYKDNLVELITIGTSRFNASYNYELHRLCSIDGIVVVGGAAKLFKYFTNNYMQKGQSLVSYCDLAKFSGDVYIKLGMTFKNISKPNYVYVNYGGNRLTRYQCMKHNLVEQGYDKNLTEEEIMKQRKYYKIYDCGNAVFTFIKD